MIYAIPFRILLLSQLNILTHRQSICIRCFRSNSILHLLLEFVSAFIGTTIFLDKRISIAFNVQTSLLGKFYIHGIISPSSGDKPCFLSNAWYSSSTASPNPLQSILDSSLDSSMGSLFSLVVFLLIGLVLPSPVTIPLFTPKHNGVDASIYQNASTNPSQVCNSHFLCMGAGVNQKWTFRLKAWMA